MSCSRHLTGVAPIRDSIHHVVSRKGAPTTPDVGATQGAVTTDVSGVDTAGQRQECGRSATQAHGEAPLRFMPHFTIT